MVWSAVPLETLKVLSIATTSEVSLFFMKKPAVVFFCFYIISTMCIAVLEHHCGKHFPGIASALVNKALALMQQGNDIDAIVSLKKAQRIHESICGAQKYFRQLHNRLDVDVADKN